jgi:lysophospholipase L1-like esterase
MARPVGKPEDIPTGEDARRDEERASVVSPKTSHVDGLHLDANQRQALGSALAEVVVDIGPRQS